MTPDESTSGTEGNAEQVSADFPVPSDETPAPPPVAPPALPRVVGSSHAGGAHARRADLPPLPSVLRRIALPEMPPPPPPPEELAPVPFEDLPEAELIPMSLPDAVEPVTVEGSDSGYQPAWAVGDDISLAPASPPKSVPSTHPPVQVRLAPQADALVGSSTLSLIMTAAGAIMILGYIAFGTSDNTGGPVTWLVTAIVLAALGLLLCMVGLSRRLPGAWIRVLAAIVGVAVLYGSSNFLTTPRVTDGQVVIVKPLPSPSPTGSEPLSPSATEIPVPQ